ncbi:MAG: hypothetical protein ACI9MR_004553 [Myxococcota bacterium]|jgi:hypothetical protein
MDAIEIPLLTQHAALPDREAILLAFAEHHDASVIRANAMNDVVEFAGEPASDTVADLDALVAGAGAMESEAGDTDLSEDTFDLGDDPFAALGAEDGDGLTGDDVLGALDLGTDDALGEDGLGALEGLEDLHVLDAEAADGDVSEAFAELDAAVEDVTALSGAEDAGDAAQSADTADEADIGVEAAAEPADAEPEEAATMMEPFALPDDIAEVLASEPAEAEAEPEPVAAAAEPEPVVAEPVKEDAPTPRKPRPRKSRKKKK